MYFKSYVLLILFIVIPVSAYASDIDANKLLIDSVKQRELDIDKVRTALKKGADPNSLWERNNNLSVLSLLSGYCHGADKEKEKKCTEVAKLLFKHGAKLQNNYGDKGIIFTPITSGLQDLTEVFLNNGAGVNKRIEGDLPIELAERYGQPKIVDLLIKYGAKRSSKKKAIQLRFLQCAYEADLKCLRKALQNGAEINTKDHRNQTALIKAVASPIYHFNEVLSVKFLLEQGADPNLKGYFGGSGISGIPLHIAIAMNSLSIKKEDSGADLVIKLLIKYGAYISGRDETLRTPLHLAAQHNNYIGAKILIDSGAKLMDRDNNGRTPLDYAESAEMIKLLKEHGAVEQ